jgi:hypothetical protein
MSLTVFAGDDQLWDVYVTKNGAPLSLAGMTAATFLVKNSIDDPDGGALITKTLAVGIAVVDAAGGHLTVTLLAADTVLMANRSLACALKIKDALGLTHTVYSGPLEIVRPAVRIAV